MKRLLASVLGLVTLAVTGSAISGYAIALLSTPPRDLIQRRITCPTAAPASGPARARVAAKNQQAVSTHKWAKGVVILYSAACPGDQRQASWQRVFGYQVFQQDGMNWQVSGSGSFESETPPPGKAPLIDYGISQNARQKSSGDRHTVLYGQVLSPKVMAVEATFDNGQTLRDLTGNGVFALVSPSATRVCQVRVLGNDRQILQQTELVIPNALRTGKPKQPCLPVSRQL